MTPQTFCSRTLALTYSPAAGGVGADRSQLSPPSGPTLSWRKTASPKVILASQALPHPMTVQQGVYRLGPLVPAWRLWRAILGLVSPARLPVAFTVTPRQVTLAQSTPVFFSPVQILILRTLPDKVLTHKSGTTSPFAGWENHVLKR